MPTARPGGKRTLTAELEILFGVKGAGESIRQAGMLGGIVDTLVKNTTSLNSKFRMLENKVFDIGDANGRMGLKIAEANAYARAYYGELSQAVLGTLKLSDATKDQMDVWTTGYNKVSNALFDIKKEHDALIQKNKELGLSSEEFVKTIGLENKFKSLAKHKVMLGLVVEKQKRINKHSGFL